MNLTPPNVRLDAVLAARASRVAYAEHGNAEREHQLRGCVSFHRLTVGSDSVDIIDYRDGAHGTLRIVAFAGTNEAADWLTNLDAVKGDWNELSVHAGFAESESATCLAIGNLGLPYASRVIITGHSLGGALASLYWLRFQEEGVRADHVTCYTFGQPRVLSRHDSKTVDSVHKVGLYRVTNRCDIVPRSPSVLRFRHMGLHLHINRHGDIIVSPGPATKLVDFVLGFRFRAIRDHFMSGYSSAVCRWIG